MKTFKVAAVSSNVNDLGLHGMILMTRSGEVWEVGASTLALKKKGEVLHVRAPLLKGFTELGFITPQQLPNATEKIIKEVWKEEPWLKNSGS
jgi:hypothetical protein